MRTNVEKFHALEQSHLVEKPINILGRRFSKPDAEHHPNYEHPHQLHHPSHHGMRHHDAADGERSPSELSLDVSLLILLLTSNIISLLVVLF